jgi:hypothetical protein
MLLFTRQLCRLNLLQYLSLRGVALEIVAKLPASPQFIVLRSTTVVCKLSNTEARGKRGEAGGADL